MSMQLLAGGFLLHLLSKFLQATCTFAIWTELIRIFPCLQTNHAACLGETFFSRLSFYGTSRTGALRFIHVSPYFIRNALFLPCHKTTPNAGLNPASMVGSCLYFPPHLRCLSYSLAGNTFSHAGSTASYIHYPAEDSLSLRGTFSLWTTLVRFRTLGFSVEPRIRCRFSVWLVVCMFPRR